MYLLSTSKSHVSSCKLLFLASRTLFFCLLFCFTARKNVTECTFKAKINLKKVANWNMVTVRVMPCHHNFLKVRLFDIWEDVIRECYVSLLDSVKYQCNHVCISWEVNTPHKQGQRTSKKKKKGFGLRVEGRTLRARFGLKEGGGFKVPAKVSPAGGGVSARRDSRSSEVWQSVSGYSCRSAMITLHSHSTALIYSNPHRNLTESASHTEQTHTQTRT